MNETTTTGQFFLTILGLKLVFLFLLPTINKIFANETRICHWMAVFLKKDFCKTTHTSIAKVIRSDVKAHLHVFDKTSGS